MKKKVPPGYYQGKDREFLCPRIFFLVGFFFILGTIFMAKPVLDGCITLNRLVLLPNIVLPKKWPVTIL